jgi:hypothetical protein
VTCTSMWFSANGQRPTIIHYIGLTIAIVHYQQFRHSSNCIYILNPYLHIPKLSQSLPYREFTIHLKAVANLGLKNSKSGDGLELNNICIPNLIIYILQLDNNSFLPLEKYRYSKHDAENISRNRQDQHLH